MSGGNGWTAGVDEAGRGPLAGPVVAAAVILDPSRSIDGLADSKVLTPAARAQLAPRIRQHAIAWGVGMASPAEIDAINILQATMLAMRRAVLALAVRPTHLEVDGNRLPSLEGLQGVRSALAIVKGDSKVAAISAHATQMVLGPSARAFTLSNKLILPVLSCEHYVLVSGTSGEIDGKGWEDDLLAGIDFTAG